MNEEHFDIDMFIDHAKEIHHNAANLNKIAKMVDIRFAEMELDSNFGDGIALIFQKLEQRIAQ